MNKLKDLKQRLKFPLFRAKLDELADDLIKQKKAYPEWVQEDPLKAKRHVALDMLFTVIVGAAAIVGLLDGRLVIGGFALLAAYMNARSIVKRHNALVDGNQAQHD